ncbi:hypothetical protein [Clostridium paraputrificum]|uniref:Uncharacterized protein n=1 Tax=Clostridium paraputrificum TaxID=29363 RepID=A0A6N3F140_9CLOT
MEIKKSTSFSKPLEDEWYSRVDNIAIKYDSIDSVSLFKEVVETYLKECSHDSNGDTTIIIRKGNTDACRIVCDYQVHASSVFRNRLLIRVKTDTSMGYIELTVDNENLWLHDSVVYMYIEDGNLIIQHK